MSEDGDNALMRLCATSKNDKIVEVAQLLIANGVNLKQTNKDGRNAVVYISITDYNKNAIVKLLNY